MVNLGSNWRDLSWPDDWTISTVDGALSAAAEETLLITETGVEILTAKGGPKKIDTTEARAKLQQEREEGREQAKKPRLDQEGTAPPSS